MENINNGAAIKKIIELALLEHRQKVREQLCGSKSFLTGKNSFATAAWLR